MNMKNKDNSYYYKLDNPNLRKQYLDNFFAVLKSYKSVIADIERRRSHARGINFAPPVARDLFLFTTR